jgi:hypothetical protein
MARIRTIKPEFWTDAKTGTLPEFSKCLFLGLLNHADDHGVLDFDPVGWRAKIFPYHSDTTPGAVREAFIHDLLARGLVVLFQIPSEDEEGFRQYIFIKNFARHQVINRPSKPLLTDWKKNDTPSSYARRLGLEHWSIGPRELDGLPEPSVSAPTPLTLGKERKGKEGKGFPSPSERAAPQGATCGEPEFSLAEPSRPPPTPPPVEPPDQEKELYRRGREVLGKSAGGLVTQLLKAKDGKIPLARAAIETASTKHDPREYIGAIIHGKPDDEPYRVIV